MRFLCFLTGDCFHYVYPHHAFSVLSRDVQALATGPGSPPPHHRHRSTATAAPDQSPSSPPQSAHHRQRFTTKTNAAASNQSPSSPSVPAPPPSPPPPYRRRHHTVEGEDASGVRLTSTRAHSLPTVGDVVQLHGLEHDTAFNGACGCLHEWIPSAQRWAIALPRRNLPGGGVRARPCHIRPIGASAGKEAPRPAASATRPTNATAVVRLP